MATAQPRVPARGCGRAGPRPRPAGDRQRGGHGHAGEPGVPGPPQRVTAPMPVSAPIAGRQRDRVVGVDDAGHVAEHQAGHHQPAAPQQRGGAGPVGARPRAATATACAASAISAAGQQPADLAAHLAAEQPGQAGRAAERRAAAAVPPPPPGPTAGLVAGRACRGRCSRRSAAGCCCRWSRRCRAGRRPGSSMTIATHQPAATSSAAPPASSCQIRLPSRGGPATR